MATILVVEDEKDIRDLICLQVEREGHIAESVPTGELAVTSLEKKLPDLIILDWMLPGLSGVEIARRLKGKGVSTPILMVTARAQSDDVIAGIEAGADDYVTKPFESAILSVRIKALLRRNQSKKAESQIQIGGLKIHFDERKAWCEGVEVPLTLSEFKLLWSLASQRGAVLTREKLISLVQGEGVNVVGRAIDTHVFGLRKKLGTHGDFIETIRGVGYRIRNGSEE